MATGGGIAVLDGSTGQDETTGRFVGTGILSKRQKLFVAALVANGGNQTAAAIIAGYQNPAGDGSRLMTLAHVRSAVREQTESLLCGGGAKSVQWLVKAMDDMALPGATRFAAAKWVAEAAGYGLASQRAALGSPDAPTSPAGMTLAQLEAMAESLERSLKTLTAESNAIPGELVPGDVPGAVGQSDP